MPSRKTGQKDDEDLQPFSLRKSLLLRHDQIAPLLHKAPEQGGHRLSPHRLESALPHCHACPQAWGLGPLFAHPSHRPTRGIVVQVQKTLIHMLAKRDLIRIYWASSGQLYSVTKGGSLVSLLDKSQTNAVLWQVQCNVWLDSMEIICFPLFNSLWCKMCLIPDIGIEDVLMRLQFLRLHQPIRWEFFYLYLTAVGWQKQLTSLTSFAFAIDLQASLASFCLSWAA